MNNLSIENRVSVSESQLSDHEQRLASVEAGIVALSQYVTDNLLVSQSTHAMLLRLIPEHESLKKKSKAVEVAKKTGGVGFLVAVGSFLQSYGPDIIRFIVDR